MEGILFLSTVGGGLLFSAFVGCLLGHFFKCGRVVGLFIGLFLGPLGWILIVFDLGCAGALFAILIEVALITFVVQMAMKEREKDRIAAEKRSEEIRKEMAELDKRESPEKTTDAAPPAVHPNLWRKDELVIIHGRVRNVTDQGIVIDCSPPGRDEADYGPLREGPTLHPSSFVPKTWAKGTVLLTGYIGMPAIYQRLKIIAAPSGVEGDGEYTAQYIMSPEAPAKPKSALEQILETRQAP